MKKLLAPISFIRVAVLTGLFMFCGMAAQAQTTIYSDDFNRAALNTGGPTTYTTTATGGGSASIISSTTLQLANGTPAGRVSVAATMANGSGFNTTLDSCSGLVTWTFNMRFGRTANTPSGFTAGNYSDAYVLASDNSDFANASAKGYAVLFGNTSSPDTFRLVAFNAGILADYTTAGSTAGSALVVGTGAFSVSTQAAANDYYSFKVTYDPSSKVWTFYGRDDGSTAFADPAAGTFTTIGTFTETTAIYRSTALGKLGALWNHSTAAGNNSQFDNFKLTVTGAGPYLAIDNTGTPATGNLIKGGSPVTVPLFGFQLTPSGGSISFTGLKLTTTGTATTSDLSNFRVVYDADNNGTFNGGDSVVSSSAQPLANPINFSITGQTAFSAARRYLLIADLAPGATVGHTFTASIAAAADVTNTATATGTAAGNQQTIAAAVYDLTMTPVTSSESPAISSLTNDTAITTTAQGTQVWQVTFTNAAGNAGADTISALTFSQGANNGVTNWQNTIRAVELFNGNTALAAGTVSPTNIVFSGLSVALADNSSATLTLRLSLTNAPGALLDNSNFQFAVTASGVTLSGINGVTTTSINSDQTQNKIDVVATKLAFTLVPTYVITNANFTAQVSAQDANGNLDVDNTSSVTISLATGGGALAGGSSLALTGGNKKWTTLTYDTLDTFSLTATDDGSVLTAATSANILARVAPTLTDVTVPQFIQGIASGSTNAKRVPYAYRVALSNLLANATYRYYNQVVLGTEAATADGAGNMIFASASGSFIRSTGPSMSSAGNYGTFTTDANGSYSGWFITEPTGNATRFGVAGNQLFMRIMLNDGLGGTSVFTRLTTASAATVLVFGTTPDATSGTGIYGNSLATDKNFAVLYDNTDGTGRPLAATLVEDDGAAETTANSYVLFYNNNVNGVSHAWGCIIPNSNANGVQRIEQRALADGSLVGFNTNTTGAWPSGANTVNPTGGDATPIVITSVDAPLTPSITTYTITATQSANGSITPSGVTTVNSGANTNYTITPNAGYAVATLTVDAGSVTPATSYAFNNVTANHTITATFAPINYTLTYNAGANGTISGTTPQTVAYLASGSLVTATPNTGYHFTTWSDSVLTAARTDVANIGGTNVTASFAINTYTVGYDGNGNTSGTAPVDASSPYNYNSTVTTKSAGSLVKTGYSFAGWNTAANGTGTGYATNATFAITANTTLFAQWTFIPIITKITVTGGNTLIDFTGGTTDSTGNFTVVGTTNLTTALTPVAPPAIITTSGAGLFRATLGVSNSAAFYRIKR